jgi:hypothetical protein
LTTRPAWDFDTPLMRAIGHPPSPIDWDLMRMTLGRREM